MTQEQPPRDLTDRLTRLETTMAGLEKMLAYREQMLQERIDRLDAQNRAQDALAEASAKDLKGSVETINATLWRGMAWLVTACGMLLVAAALKVLGLV